MCHTASRVAPRHPSTAPRLQVPCQQWALEQPRKNANHTVTLQPLALGGTNHVSMVSDKKVIQMVLRIVSNQEL